MLQSVTIAPPYSVVLITGRDDGGDIPPSMGRSVIAATESCIAVGCLSDADGPTEFVLGPTREIAAAGEEPVFEGRLQTPDSAVVVRSIEGEIILETQVSTKNTLVRIWVNDVLEPSRILIGVG